MNRWKASVLGLFSSGLGWAAGTPGPAGVLDAGDPAREDPMVRLVIREMPAGSPAAADAWLDVEGVPHPVPAMRDPGESGVFWFRLPGTLPAHTTRRVALRGWKDAPAPGQPRDVLTLTDTTGHEILRYHAAPDPAPPGASARFARSGFIHPLFSPDGDPLTGSRPADHLHHMGVWHAWTHARYHGEDLDFWNLKEGTGTVRFDGWDWIRPGGPDQPWAGFQVRQGHIAWPGSPRETRVLDEVLVVRAWREAGMLVTDYRFRQHTTANDPLELPAYRYGGGVGYRAPDAWVKENSEYLTSEGHTRRDAFGTRARWAAAYGPVAHGTAGTAVFSHPENHEFPEWLRTWQDDQGGRVFMNFVPVQKSPWEIPAGHTQSFRYRLVTFTGRPDAARLERMWQDFAHPPQVILH